MEFHGSNIFSNFDNYFDLHFLSVSLINEFQISLIQLIVDSEPAKIRL